MDIIEIRMIRDAIAVYCTRKGKDRTVEEQLHKDVDDSIEYWNKRCGKDDNVKDMFSEHFWKVLDKYFTDKCINALKDRYIDKLTYQAIGDKYQFSKTCAEQKVKQILEKLPKYKIWRELLFDEIYLIKERKCVPRETVYGTDLSSRAKTSLVRFMEEQSKLEGEEILPTPENIVKYLTNLNMLTLCGGRTRNEILKFFKQLGYEEVVNTWIRQYKEELLNK